MSRPILPCLETLPSPRRRFRWCRAAFSVGVIAVLAGVVGFAPAAPRAARAPQPAAATAAARRQAARQQLARLPLEFELNRGQTDARAQFVARTPGGVVFLTSQGAVIKTAPGVVRMRFAGARPQTGAQALEPASTNIHYLLGHRSFAAPGFDKIRYSQIYPGVDLVYYGNQNNLEYDLALAPGADPERVQIAFAGATPALAADGSLRLARGVSLRRPVAYQTVAGRRQAVAAHYVLGAGHNVGIALGAYDHARTLTIDPVLVYATYLGGTAFNSAAAVAVDSSGCSYIAGYTESPDFPVTTGAYDTTYNTGNFDAFVAKLAANGTSEVYATYIGGTLQDEANGIAVDASGDAYITGYTDSANFPTLNAYQSALAGTNYNVFAAEINPTGTGLVYSTYLGGSAGESEGNAIALDGNDDAYITGFTAASNYPVTAGAPQSTLVGTQDAFVTALSSSGSLIYSTHLGGTGAVTAGNGIAVDSTANAYVGGSTNASSGFPVSSGAYQPTNGGGYDGFVVKLSSSGTTIAYATFLGGSAADSINAIAVDAAGQAFVTGSTRSTNIFANPTFQGHLNGIQNAFVAELNIQGNGLNYASYLGGSGTDSGTGIAVDPTDVAYLTGYTDSTDFPVVGPTQAVNGGDYDAFIAKVDSDGASLLYSSYLGGLSNDFAYGLALDLSSPTTSAEYEDLYITGQTESENFPVVSSTAGTVVQPDQNSNNDAFVAKLIAAPEGSFSPNLLGFPAQATGVASTSEAVVFTNNGEKPLIVSSITMTGPYKETDNCSANSSTLQPTSYCTINVVFTPTGTGSENGTLSVNDNSPNSPQVLQLEGSGGNFTMAVSPTTATVVNGSSVTYSVVVTPAAGYTQVVQLTCTGSPLPPNTTCTPSPTSLTNNGTTAQTSTYTVTTTVRPTMVPPGPSIPSGPWTWVVLAGLGLALLTAAYAALSRWGRGRRKLGWVGVAVLAGWALATVACGGAGTNPGTAAGDYTLNFIGTVGSVTQTVSATITVD